MVGQIDDSLLVAFGLKFNGQFIIVVPRINHCGLKRSGIALFAIFRRICELYMATFSLAVPNLVHKALRTSVQGIRSVIDGQLILLAANVKLTFRDTVGITSGSFTGARPVGYVVGGIGISQCHIGKFSVLVRHHYTYNAGSESRQGDGCARSIG